MKILMLIATAIIGANAEPYDCTNYDKDHIVCHEILAPVCGSDGKTYDNECMLEAAKCEQDALMKLFDGECPRVQCEMACTREYVPVCGSDGKTYSNKCVLRNAQCTNKSLQKVSDGKCKTSRNLRTDCDSTMCLMNYAPVCGSDNQTYSNMCMFEIAQCHDPSLMLVRTGACEKHA